MVNKFVLISILTIFILSLSLTNAITITDFNSANIVTANSSHLLSYNVTTDLMSNLTYTFNGSSFNIMDGLVLAYNFDNKSALGENDTKVVDISGNGNNGSVIGYAGASCNVSMTSQGKYNGGINFSGNQNWINGQNSQTLNFTNQNFTISMWVKTTDFGHQQRLLNKRTGNTGYQIYLTQTTGKVDFFVGHGTGNAAVEPSTGLVLNTWNHIVALYNGTSVVMYINGVYKTSTSEPNALVMASTSLTIGGSSSSDGFNGTIDSTMIWNRSLSASEIGSLYNSQLTKFDTENWTYQNNVTNVSVYSQSFSLSVSNLTTSISSSNTIRQLNTITADYATSKGIINPYFYGTQVYAYGFSSTGLLADNACTNNVVNEYLSARNTFLDTKMNIIRYDFPMDSMNSVTSVGSGMKNVAEIVEWAYNNNVKVNLLAYKTPEWLANKTSGWCTLAGSNVTCPSTNYTQFGLTVVNALNNVTNNGLYNSAIYSVEVWNEPYATQWLNNLSVDNITKATEYVKLYNATYDAIKLTYPTMRVGGATLWWNGGSVMANTFMSNLTNKWDLLYVHQYLYEQPYSSVGRANYSIRLALNWVNGLCTTYSANCSNIYLSEFNLIKDSGFSFTNQHGATIADAFIFMLNNYTSNITTDLWKFDTFATTNISCDGDYNYSMYNQNTGVKQVPFSVTSNFTRYAPASGTMYSSTNDADDNCIQTSTSQIGTTKSLILLNTCSYAKNISTTFSETTIKVSDGTLYNSGANDLGIIGGYGVEYYTEPSTSQVHGVGYFNNYFGEEIREMTGDEHDAYFPDSLGCDSNYFAGSALIMILSSLAIVSVTLYFTFKDGWENITVGNILLLGIVLIVIIVLWTAAGQNLGSYCN